MTRGFDCCPPGKTYIGMMTKPVYLLCVPDAVDISVGYRNLDGELPDGQASIRFHEYTGEGFFRAEGSYIHRECSTGRKGRIGFECDPAFHTKDVKILYSAYGFSLKGFLRGGWCDSKSGTKCSRSDAGPDEVASVHVAIIKAGNEDKLPDRILFVMFYTF